MKTCLASHRDFDEPVPRSMGCRGQVGTLVKYSPGTGQSKNIGSAKIKEGGRSTYEFCPAGM